jgi:hypothetical protein
MKQTGMFRSKRWLCKFPTTFPTAPTAFTSIAGRAKPSMFLPFIQLEGIRTRLAGPDEGFGAVRHSKDYPFKVTLWKDF